MADKNRPIEQETQNEKKQEATKDQNVDVSDAEEGIEPETQHEKKKAATKPGREKN